jgi:hypothetical protein
MDLWEKAKAKARLQGKENDWSTVFQIYKESGGTQKCIILLRENSISKYLGKDESGKLLIKNLSDGSTSEITLEQFNHSKKSFKDVRD